MDQSSNLSDLFEEGFALGRKDKTALLMHSGNGLSTTSTYADVSELSNIVASVLKDINCSRKFIGVISSTSIHIPAIILGILKLPACFVPVGFQANTALNEFIFSKLNIEHVICMKRDSPQFIEKLGKQLNFHCLDTPALFPYQLVVLKQMSQASDHKQEQDNAGIAYAMHTSGTTGRPKIVRVPHRCIVPNIISLRTKLKVTHDDVVFMASPLTFDPCIVEMFLALSTGAALFMVPMTTKLMPQKLAQALQDNNVTILQATSSLVSRFGPTLLKNTILSRDTKLRALVLGGEQCPVPAVLCNWRAEGNVTTMWNIYGITEVSSWASLYQIPEQDIKNAINQSVPLGEPLLGTVIQVRDDRGQAITSGKGHLYIGGKERVCLVDNECVLVPGTLRASGDIVQFTSKGLVYVGRIDQQIKRHGQRINLQQLTEVILSALIFNSCCLLYETETDELLLFAVPKFGLTEQMSFNMIYKELENTLPKNCIPDQVCLLDELPVTRHGKVDAKKLLEQRKVARLCKNGGCLSNEELHNLWKDILQVDSKIEDDSNFIQLGGDSFQAVRLLNQIELVIGRSIPDLLDFILHRTYHEVFELVKNESCVTFKHGHNFESIPFVEQSSSSVPCGLLQNDVLTNKQFTDMRSEHCTSKFEKVSQQISLHDNVELKKRTLGLIKNDGSLSSKKSKKDAADTFQMDVNRESLDCSIKNETMTVYSSIRRGSQVLQHHKKQNKLLQNVNRGQQTVCIVEKWKCDTGKCIDASPLLVTTDGVNAVVYIGSHSHKFLAISCKTGVPIWSTTLGDRVESSACLSMCASYIVFGCYDHNVYILNAKNGEIIWFWKTSGPVKSSPIVHPHTGIIYVGSHDQNIHALDIKNKQCLFSTHCGGGSVFSSPCIDVTMGTIYVGTLSGILTCINLVSGEIKWMYRIGKPIFSSPAVTKEGVMVGCVDNYLYHISSLNEMIWSFKTDAPIFSSPCLSSTNDLTVFGSHDSCIYCIHSSTGKQVWRFKTTSPVYATPFVFYNDLLQSAEGNSEYFVVCCCTEGSLYILNLSTGCLVLSWVASHLKLRLFKI
ncbi:beta-alanine-activating enzyme-like [Anneissia japonica]|uniref:beta-alanine-activating enzyme-like n=1 Tax=Anneissia japonica TaxID=1529436 RepID=UPI001425556D|nr:beta-alanine-activating enzyme-like [Anneissia japonica]